MRKLILISVLVLALAGAVIADGERCSASYRNEQGIVFVCMLTAGHGSAHIYGAGGPLPDDPPI